MILLIKKSSTKEQKKKPHAKLLVPPTVCHPEVHVGPPFCWHGVEKAKGWLVAFLALMVRPCMRVLLHRRHWPPLTWCARQPSSYAQSGTPASLWAHYRHLITEIPESSLSIPPSKESPRLFLAASGSWKFSPPPSLLLSPIEKWNTKGSYFIGETPLVCSRSEMSVMGRVCTELTSFV